MEAAIAAKAPFMSTLPRPSTRPSRTTPENPDTVVSLVERYRVGVSAEQEMSPLHPAVQGTD